MNYNVYDLFEAGSVEVLGWRVFFEISANSNGLRYLELSIQPCN